MSSRASGRKSSAAPSRTSIWWKASASSPRRNVLPKCLARSGFYARVGFTNYTGGVVALHRRVETLMARSIRNSLRLARIAWVLARNDALFLLENTAISPHAHRLLPLACRAGASATLRPGQRLANALQQLGPTFIKLGQSFSTRSDIVGEEIAADLANLQDRLPPFPTAAGACHSAGRIRPARLPAFRPF